MPQTKLSIPPEPKDIKEMIAQISTLQGKNAFGMLWYGNRIASYLWSYWGSKLSSRGMRWQDFLHALREWRDDFIRWLEGETTWEALMEKITESLSKETKVIGLTKWMRVRGS